MLIWKFCILQYNSVHFISNSSKSVLIGEKGPVWTKLASTVPFFNKYEQTNVKLNNDKLNKWTENNRHNGWEIILNTQKQQLVSVLTSSMGAACFLSLFPGQCYLVEPDTTWTILVETFSTARC